MPPTPLRYCITDRRLIPGGADLPAYLASLAAAGAFDYVQIREKDLPARELFDLTRRTVELLQPFPALRVLVNERADIAIAAGAHGVHLPSNAPSPRLIRTLAPGLLIGVSCHTADDLTRAEREGADFAVLAPVFAPLSKKSEAPPLGLAGFGRLAHSVKLPVLALGGITAESIPDCLAAGAAGIAAISLYFTSEPRTPASAHTGF